MQKRIPATVLLLILLLVPTLLARAQSPDHFLITIAAPSPAERTALVNGPYDVWGVTDESVILLVDREALQNLQYQGVQAMRVEPLAFPPDFDDYHDYAEMVADLQALAAAYPQITALTSIGQSHEGRDIWALRISDRPQETEPGEKGILIYGNTHAREHLTLEQVLFLARDLLENYGREGEATNLVNQRDIWLIPNLNPDGTEYDIDQWTSSPPYWRKNRRDNGNGTWGVDLNRNFGYKWGCCGGSSGATSSDTYRGPAPFSEPESVALRDFVIDHPHLTVTFSLHTWGELILYPYGYTYQDLPPDMDPDDAGIFRAMASDLAALNGYTAQQSSDLYITDGDHDDWMYGDRGIYAMTWELYPRSYNPGFYPPDDIIPAQTERNRTALRYGISLADDPAKSVGEGADMTPPAIQILTPSDGTPLYEGEPITITVEALDDTAVTTVEYLLDGEPVVVLSAADFATSLTLPAGDYELNARAFDAAHWQTLSDPVSLHVSADTGPTFTPTPTASATPTATSTPSPTATPPDNTCVELIGNGSFEQDEAWIFLTTVNPGDYSEDQAHTGVRAARLGLLPEVGLYDPGFFNPALAGLLAPDDDAYSSVRQALTLPADADAITLQFWYHTGSDDTDNDFQTAMLLRSDQSVEVGLMRVLEDDRAWKQATFDLSAYVGRELYTYFGVYNDSIGSGDRTWMYVDDVSVQACYGLTPTPTATPTPFPLDEQLYLPLLFQLPAPAKQ